MTFHDVGDKINMLVIIISFLSPTCVIKVLLFTGFYIYILSRIRFYSTIHTTDAVYTFGGDPVEVSNMVAEYKNDQWRRLPDLKNGRWFHASIKMGQAILIFGGQLNSNTEK